MTSNPPVPDELLEHEELLTADAIGETAYSKQFCFKLLTNLIKEAENQAADDEVDVVDISDQFQDDLCQLWDMAVNPDVAEFLHEYKTESILTMAIEQSKSPRMTEICLGVLDNMACHPLLRAEIGGNEIVRLAVCGVFIGSDDSPSLVVASRLIAKCVECHEVLVEWVTFLVENEEALREKTRFILSSSRMTELLSSVASLLYTILNCDVPRVAESWLSPELLDAISEALSELEREAKVERLLMCAAKFPEEIIRSSGGAVAAQSERYLRQLCADDALETSGIEVALVSASSLLRVARGESLLTDAEFAEWVARMFLSSFSRLRQFLQTLESEDSLTVLRPRKKSAKMSSQNGVNGDASEDYPNANSTAEENLDVFHSEDEMTYKHVSSLVQSMAGYSSELILWYKEHVTERPEDSNERGDVCGAAHRLLQLLDQTHAESLPFVVDVICSQNSQLLVLLRELALQLKLTTFCEYLQLNPDIKRQES